ncbi:MAG: hypothetical protein M3Q80_01175 [bacterium]|nr:hypothetical protein [bacterium]
MNEAEARKLIKFHLRQLDGGYYPLKIKPSPQLLKLLPIERIQVIYDEELALIEAKIGKLRRWDTQRDEAVR